jgi:dethiobiotin synthetase
LLADNSSRARGVFVSATGTGVGKTLVSTALIHALVRRGIAVAGLKPIETGCVPFPLDAQQLAHASRKPALADLPCWYRAEPPLAPYAVELATGRAAPDCSTLATNIRALGRDFELVVVEGAGGLLVPLDRTRSMADLVAALGLPVLIVADDRLGVLSHVLTTVEAALRRELSVLAVVLNQSSAADSNDPSAATNRHILAERLELPILIFPQVAPEQLHDAASLALHAETSGLVELLIDQQRTTTAR